jgi:small subunit ribosomal protein S6
LPETEIESEIKKVEELITSGGGEIVEIQRWGIKRFAYEIDRKRQGYYAHFLYKAKTSLPASLEATFKVNEKIIRFLTVVSEVDLEKRALQLSDPSAAASIPNAETLIESRDAKREYRRERY